MTVAYRELFGSALQPLEFELDDGPAIEALLAAYPQGVVVTDLEHPSEELDDKLGVAQALYKEGFLLIEDEASNPSAGTIARSKHNNNNSKDISSGGNNSKDSSSGGKKIKSKSKAEAARAKQQAQDDDDDPF